MEKIISKLLEEVDSDIREFLLAEVDMQNVSLRPKVVPKNWQLFENPIQEIVSWQLLRLNKPVISGKEIVVPCIDELPAIS